MLRQIKITAAALCAVILIALAVYLFFALSRSSSLTAALPQPSDNVPYLLIETKDKTYPAAVSSFLTDGVYAPLKEGTPRNVILSIAAAAEDAAVMIEEKENSSAEVYAALRFSASDMKLLKKGQLPDPIKEVLKSPSLSAAEDGAWLLHTKDSDSPVYCKADGKRAIFAAEESSFRLMLDLAAGRGNSMGRKKWHEEKSWPGHIEICDGGLLTAKEKKQTPLKVEASWHKTEATKLSEASGELRWRVSGLDSLMGSLALNALSAKKWNTENSFIPEPLLLSMGINLPPLKGSPEDWPFPLSSIGDLGKTMELSDSQISRVLSGQTIFSLGGQNRILWFSLPGFMVEFTGDKKDMQNLVEVFWKKLFLGTEPKPISGFEYGGTAELPFSVIGAGRGGSAVLGLASPESVSPKNKLGRFLKEDEKAIGWIVADLPRIGAALSDMTKMNSFVEDEEEEDDPAFSYDSEEPEGGEVFQPEMSFSPFDQGVTDSFGNVLKKLGKVLIVWEKSDSGRLNWYAPKVPKAAK